MKEISDLDRQPKGVGSTFGIKVAVMTSDGFGKLHLDEVNCFFFLEFHALARDLVLS